MVDWNNVSPDVLAKRLADARRHVNDGWQPDYSNPVSRPIFDELVKTQAIPEWEAEHGEQWSLDKVQNAGKIKAKPWTEEQYKTIEERLARRLQGMGNRLGRSPEELHIWLEKVKGLYAIGDNNDEVISYAKDDKMKNGKPQVWPVADESQAEDKIVQLLEWKISGRSIGRGDIDKDLGNTQQLY